MTNELTLREKVLSEIEQYVDGGQEYLLENIATLLEDTGSPAHMRVAAELG